jgi:hypothetical protein
VENNTEKTYLLLFIVTFIKQSGHRAPPPTQSLAKYSVNPLDKHVSITCLYRNKPPSNLKDFFFFLLICAYKAWVISPPCPHPLPYHPLRPLPLPPIPSIPSRNYFALISNFVVESV